MSDSLRGKRLRSETQISKRRTMNDNKRYLFLISIIKHLNDIIIHNYSNTQMKVYAKNSFDRFGDDLTEEILQYLTFEDKVRLECVSKQWRRLVFNKQFVIERHSIDRINESKDSLNQLYREINENSYKIRLQALESVLKKCHYIKKIDLTFGINEEVLSLIDQYCPNIKSLTYNQNTINDNVLSFFRINGHKLEELYLFDKENMKELANLCPNVKKITVHNTSVIYNTDKDYLPKLQYIVTTFSGDFTPKDILFDKYSKTLKCLNATFNYHYSREEMLLKSINCISEFENLKELHMNFCGYRTRQSIDDCLKLIGQKCNKLLILYLCFGLWNEISDRFYEIFSEFKAIKKLTIWLSLKFSLSGSVECFKHCKQLKELIIIDRHLTEDFFANIASFVPKLQFLCIGTESKQFSNSFIDSFHTMKYIQDVRLIDYNQKQNFHKRFWYFDK